MNRETRAQLRAKRLADVSRRVREENMRVNAEFAAIERDPMPERGEVWLADLDPPHGTDLASGARCSSCRHTPPR